MKNSKASVAMAIAPTALTLRIRTISAKLGSGRETMMTDKKALPVLEVCPVCGLVPNLGYCCGEYMVSCLDPYCPVGGNTFTEMHSSEQRVNIRYCSGVAYGC